MGKIELTQEQLEKALEAQRKYEKMQAINKRSYERRNAWMKLMIQKAEAAKIEVSDQEVEAWLKANPKKSK